MKSYSDIMAKLQKGIKLTAKGLPYKYVFYKNEKLYDEKNNEINVILTNYEWHEWKPQ